MQQGLDEHLNAVGSVRLFISLNFAEGAFNLLLAFLAAQLLIPQQGCKDDLIDDAQSRREDPGRARHIPGHLKSLTKLVEGPELLKQ